VGKRDFKAERSMVSADSEGMLICKYLIFFPEGMEGAEFPSEASYSMKRASMLSIEKAELLS